MQFLRSFALPRFVSRSAIAFGAVGALAVAAAAGAPAALSATPAAAPAIAAGDSVVFTGHGWGHGRGMGQYGALGYAKQGWTHEAILAHYYGNTILTKTTDTLMTVRLMAQDNKTLDVYSDQGFTAGGVPIAPGDAAHITATPSGGAAITVTAGCTGPVRSSVNTANARAVPPVAGLNRPAGENLRLCGSGARYRGTLLSVNDGGALRTVSSVSIEDYLRAVVPRESSAGWADQGGAAALRTQAVAARSYSTSETRWSYAKTCDTQSCQMYGDTSKEDYRSDAAIAATAGMVLTRNGAAVRAEFSTSTGGYTAGGAFPAVVDAGDSVSPYLNWTTRIPAATIAASFNVGTLTGIQVTARNGLGADGGRATSVAISGTARAVVVTGDQVEYALGLKSNWFSIGASTPGVDNAAATPALDPWLQLWNWLLALLKSFFP